MNDDDTGHSDALGISPLFTLPLNVLCILNSSVTCSIAWGNQHPLDKQPFDYTSFVREVLNVHGNELPCFGLFMLRI